MCQAFEAEHRFVTWIERASREEHERGEHAMKPRPDWCVLCRLADIPAETKSPLSDALSVPTQKENR